MHQSGLRYVSLLYCYGRGLPKEINKIIILRLKCETFWNSVIITMLGMRPGTFLLGKCRCFDNNWGISGVIIFLLTNTLN